MGTVLLTIKNCKQRSNKIEMDASLSFYERLEITRFSTQSEIKLAYENKSVEMRHTDRYTRGLLIEAFSVLKDIEQKGFYDKGFRMGQLKSNVNQKEMSTKK